MLIYLKKINKVYTVQCKTLNSMNFNWICLENAGVCVVYVYACTCTNACVCFLQVWVVKGLCKNNTPTYIRNKILFFTTPEENHFWPSYVINIWPQYNKSVDYKTFTSFHKRFVVLYHAFESMWVLADGPSDDWTVPSYLAWPTALSTECSLIELLCSACSGRSSETIRSKPGRTDSLNTCYLEHTYPAFWLFNCGGGACFPGLAGWVWSGRQGEVRSWFRAMMELESASIRGELGAVGDSLQPQTPSRHEKSLGLLTTKFVTLLQEAKDGVLDLKAVSMQPRVFVVS